MGLPEVSSTSLTAFSTPTTPPPLPQLLAQPPLFQLSPAQAAHLMSHSHLASLHPPPSPRSQRATQRLPPPALPEPHQCRLVRSVSELYSVALPLSWVTCKVQMR